MENLTLIANKRKYISIVDVEKWKEIQRKFLTMRKRWNDDLNNCCEVIHVDFKTKEVKRRDYIIRQRAA